jgi:hypothetical protein
MAGEIDRAHVLGLAGQFVGVLLRRPLDQHRLHAADHGFRNLRRMRIDMRLQPFQPRMFHGIRGAVVQVRSGGAGTARIDEGEALVEADVFNQLHRLVEIGIGFAGKADDEIGRNRDVRPYRAQLADLGLEFQRRVAAFHRAEDAIAAGLHRQVQVVGQLRHVAIGLDQRVGKLQRMRSGEADATNAFYFSDGANQQAQVSHLIVALASDRSHPAAIGVDVLAKQIDFAHTLRSQLRYFHQHVLERSADFLATGIRHHAERAVLRTAFHDRHECAGAFGARFRQAVELFDLGKADVDLRLAAGAAFADQFRQPVQRLRTKHQIHVRCPLDDGGAFLRGDAAADSDDHRLAAGFERLPAAQLAEHLFLRLLANGAGVDQHDIGLFGVVGQLQPFGGGQHVGHLGRVVLVHLATVGLDVELAPCRQAIRQDRTDRG